MYSICLRYANNKDDADDIFQQSFYLVYKNINQLKNCDALSGWIKRIFVNCAIEHNRKASQLRIVEDIDVLAEKSTTINKALDNLAIDELTILIQQLPEGCKKVFNLYVIEEFSHKEIAEQLNISLGTSKSQLHDARKMLKQKIILNSSVQHKKLSS
ncbi:MAG: hypothetical protein COA97_09100 [Flavobacteriales bacterium]|nr:MAG: hypothetical protein COA97_09100 [Flavobacteriales bacterium]